MKATAASGLEQQLAEIALVARGTPLVIPWPVPGVPGAFLSFERLDDWRAFVASLDLDERIPRVVGRKFTRALRLLYLAWIDADLIKASELVALATLELALKDRYGGAYSGGNLPPFGTLLKAMVEDGLTDADIPLVVRCGGSAIGRVTGADRPSLREIRNSLAHGDPFDGFPHSGLVELVRDLIHFAYRPYLDEAGTRSAGRQ